MPKTARRELPPHLQAEAERLAAMPDDTIDLTEMPEWTDFSKAVRGKFYRPVKEQVTLRIDADLIHWFKAGGRGYQTKINQALRDYVDHERKAG